MEKTLETALQAINSGYSIIPIHKADPDLGDKRPAVNWKKYQTTKMGKEDAQKWFTSGEYAIAVLMGSASGGLLMIELEGRAAKYLPILTQTAHDSGLKALWQKLFQWCEQTPTGGWHFYIKCTENSHGNRKLAKTSSGEVLAETRENGGYSVIAPADGAIFHHGGEGAWQQISGNPTTAATVTLEELDTLLDIFRSINQDVKPAPQPTLEASSPHRDNNNGVTPGDDYENKTSWGKILMPHGWARLHTDQDGTTYWRRPGKTPASPPPPETLKTVTGSMFSPPPLFSNRKPPTQNSPHTPSSTTAGTIKRRRKSSPKPATANQQNTTATPPSLTWTNGPPVNKTIRWWSLLPIAAAMTGTLSVMLIPTLVCCAIFLKKTPGQSGTGMCGIQLMVRR